MTEHMASLRPVKAKQSVYAAKDRLLPGFTRMC